MPDIGSNIPQNLGHVLGKQVQATPEQKVQPTGTGTNLGAHTVSKKPPESTRPTLEKMKQLYIQKIKSFTPEKLQEEISKTEHEIKAL